MATEYRPAGIAGRHQIYTHVAAKIITDIESTMGPPGHPPDLGVDIKLLLAQMTNELAAHEHAAKSARKIGAGFVAEELFRSTGARFSYGGDWPHYDEGEDVIYFPLAGSFKPEECHLTAKARELVHWTRHKSRLDRAYGASKFGTEGHAREQLVGEFGTAFLCALLEITPQVSKRHAANIARWLRAIKIDRRAALSSAMKDAVIAVECLFSLQQRRTP